MAQWSFPFPDNNGDRVYSDEDFALFYANLFTNGVIATVGNALRVTESATGGMRVVVKNGAVIINGRQYFNTDDLAISVPVASTTQNRTDSVILRLDIPARNITLAYKQGDTSVQQDEQIFELQLATINVGRNTVNIFNENITDKRADETVCGYSSPYEKVSVSGLEQQYESMLQQMFDEFVSSAEDNKLNLEQLLTDQQVLFQNWLTNLQNQLDENQAANLQKQIDEIKPTVDSFTFVHNLGMYPQVQVLYHEYGLGTVPLEEQPEGIRWDGTAPVTLSNAIEHNSRQEFNVKLPVGYSLMNPTITAIDKYSFLLNEGIRSIEVRIIAEPEMKELSRNIVVMTGEGYDNLEHKDKDTLYMIVAGDENE
jgi:hypothetical protein